MDYLMALLARPHVEIGAESRLKIIRLISRPCPDRAWSHRNRPARFKYLDFDCQTALFLIFYDLATRWSC